MKNWRIALPIAGLVAAANVAGAQAATTITPFAVTDLDGVSALVGGFLAVGAIITLGMTLYRKGRQGANKV